MYKLGVLIAVHNGDEAPLFRRAIRSVLDQKLSLEVAIRIYLGVDGPVNPSLAAAIHEIEPFIYRLLWFPQNRGLVYVLNDLLASREDEAFYFRMDADDFSMPNRFQRQLEHMIRLPDIDILGTDIWEIDGTSGRARVVHFADSPENARARIARGVPVAHPTACFRAGVFDKVPRYPSVRLNEDIEMWFACLRAGMRFDNVPEPLYEFRISPQFWNRRGWSKTWSEFAAYIRGIWALDGITWQYVFPVARLLLRLAPIKLKQYAYGSRFRKVRWQTRDEGGGTQSSPTDI